MFALCYAIYVYICFLCILYMCDTIPYMYLCMLMIYMCMYVDICIPIYVYVMHMLDMYMCVDICIMYVLYTSDIVISCLVECWDDIERYAMIA